MKLKEKQETKNVLRKNNRLEKTMKDGLLNVKESVKKMRLIQMLSTLKMRELKLNS